MTLDTPGLWAATAPNHPVPSTSDAASTLGIRSGVGSPGVLTSVPSASDGELKMRSPFA